MSYLNVLKNGEIPPKKSKKAKLTTYDEYMSCKKLSMPTGNKNIAIKKPKTFGDIQKLIVRLKNNQGIIVDLSDTECSLAQRMLDFLSGAVFALDGDIDRVDNKMYVMTPSGVEIISKLDD